MYSQFATVLAFSESMVASLLNSLYVDHVHLNNLYSKCSDHVLQCSILPCTCGVVKRTSDSEPTKELTSCKGNVTSYTPCNSAMHVAEVIMGTSLL